MVFDVFVSNFRDRSESGIGTADHVHRAEDQDTSAHETKKFDENPTAGIATDIRGSRGVQRHRQIGREHVSVLYGPKFKTETGKCHNRCLMV